jgi:hypothetical protein
MSGMGRRPVKDADEQDVHTAWRRLYCWTQRAGATDKVKRRSRRRERHAAKAMIRRGDDA